MIDKEKQIQKFMFSMFAFSEDEMAAMGKIITMTQEIFDSCMDKCMKAGGAADVDFNYLIEEFPEMADRYMKKFVKRNVLLTNNMEYKS